MMEIEKFIPQRISELRRQLNISAREMSLRLGQNSNYINKVENGKIMPSLPSLFYICEFCHINLKAFFDDGINLPIIVDELFNDINKLSESDLNLIIALSKRLSTK